MKATNNHTSTNLILSGVLVAIILAFIYFSYGKEIINQTNIF